VSTVSAQSLERLAVHLHLLVSGGRLLSVSKNIRTLHWERQNDLAPELRLFCRLLFLGRINAQAERPSVYLKKVSGQLQRFDTKDHAILAGHSIYHALVAEDYL